MINIKDIFSKAINFVKSNKYINKYTIALVIFLIIYIFCSEHSYIKTKKLERQIEKTDKQIEYYETNIKNNREKTKVIMLGIKRDIIIKSTNIKIIRVL